MTKKKLHFLVTQGYSHHIIPSLDYVSSLIVPGSIKLLCLSDRMLRAGISPGVFMLLPWIYTDALSLSVKCLSGVLLLTDLLQEPCFYDPSPQGLIFTVVAKKGI